MSFYTKDLSEAGFRKSHLKELMRKAYDAGFLPSIEWRQAEIFINRLEANHVESQVAYYSRLIASKETTNKAA